MQVLYCNPFTWHLLAVRQACHPRTFILKKCQTGSCTLFYTNHKLFSKVILSIFILHLNYFLIWGWMLALPLSLSIYWKTHKLNEQSSWNFIVFFKPLFLINYIFYHIVDPLMKKSVLIEQLLWCLVNNLIFGACLLRCHPCVENKFHTCNFPGFSGHPLFSSYNLNRLIHKKIYLFFKLDTYLRSKETSIKNCLLRLNSTLYNR